MDIKALERFQKSKSRFKLTKIGSKRASYIGVGQFEVGDFHLHEYPATKTLPEAVGVEIVGNGFDFLRTSPVVKIIDHSENTTTFETEGGIYKLEKL